MPAMQPTSLWRRSLARSAAKRMTLMGVGGNGYTDPAVAAEFVERTGIDSLAGNWHRAWCLPWYTQVGRQPPGLRSSEPSRCRLYRTGTSGVPDDAVRECSLLAASASKVNYATDLRIAFSKGLKEFPAKDPDAFDPKSVSAAGREQVNKE